MNAANTQTLYIKLSYEKPISVNDLYKSIRGISNIYSRVNTDANCELYINKISDGSIDFQFIVGTVGQLLVLPSTVNVIVDFYNHLSMIIAKLKKEENSLVDLYDYKKDIQDIEPLIRTVQNVNGASEFFLEDNNGKIYNNCNFSINNYSVMQENIRKAKVGDNDPVIKEQVLFRWSRVDLQNNQTGNKGIIPEVTKEPVKVIFDKHTDFKNKMIEGESWHLLNYIVDVQITYDENNKVKLYKIINFYPEDSFLD